MRNTTRTALACGLLFGATAFASPALATTDAYVRIEKVSSA
jgi:hypothetical protein